MAKLSLLALACLACGLLVAAKGGNIDASMNHADAYDNHREENGYNDMPGDQQPAMAQANLNMQDVVGQNTAGNPQQTMSQVNQGHPVAHYETHPDDFAVTNNDYDAGTPQDDDRHVNGEYETQMAQQVDNMHTHVMNKQDHMTHANGYAEAFHDVHEFDDKGKPSMDHHTCQGLSVQHTAYHVHQSECLNVCVNKGSDFWAPNTLEQARCLDHVHNHTAFWVNMQQRDVQGMPVLFNRYTQEDTQNFAPVIRRNSHNGLIFDHAAKSGKNCVYYDPITMMNKGTSCANDGNKIGACVCKRARHHNIPCRDIHILDAKRKVSMTHCERECARTNMAFFAPSNKNERDCLVKAGAGSSVWIDMIQFFPVPGSQALAFRENLMNREIAEIPDKPHFGIHPRKNPVTISKSGHKAGLSQNCLYAAITPQNTVNIIGSDCQTKISKCACTSASFFNQRK